MAGRRSKYTPETVGRILQAIELGSSYDLAAAYAGINYSTLNDWRKAKPQFDEQLKRAEGKAVAKWLAIIERAAQNGQWQAAAWKLERRHTEVFGRQIHEHGGRSDKPIQHHHRHVHIEHDLSVLTPDEIAVLDKIAATHDPRVNGSPNGLDAGEIVA